MRIKNNTYFKILSLVVSGAFLVGCTTAHVSQNNIDNIKAVDTQSIGLITERIDQESAKFLDEKRALYEAIEEVAEEIPEVIAITPEFNPLDVIKISINVNNGDVQSILQAISDQAGMSLLMDPELSELRRKISMHLTDVPASLVFDQVMGMLDLDGEVIGNVLVVKSYREKVYELNFLQTSSTISSNMGGDVFGANDGGGSMVSSLSFSGSGATDNNPYSQLLEMLEDVLGRNKTDQADSVIPGIARQQPVGGAPQEPAEFRSIFSLNEMTGTLYVKARPSQVEAIDKMIEQFKSVLSRQVLIEAQLLDIRLFEGHRFGVDWSNLSNSMVSRFGAGTVNLGGVATNLPGAANQVRSITIPASNHGLSGGKAFNMVYSGDAFSGALEMLQQFGTLRVLANPSIRAKNARPAFISVGRNTQYISESSSTTNNIGGGATTTTTDVTTSSVFDGVILGFETFIDAEGKISLTIHPMQSTVDKASMVLIDAGNGTKITLPVIDFKGLTTSLSLNDGDTVVLGGLMDEVASDRGEGLPGLNEIPGIGALFGGNRTHSKVTREMVMILRVTIL